VPNDGKILPFRIRSGRRIAFGRRVFGAGCSEKRHLCVQWRKTVHR